MIGLDQTGWPRLGSGATKPWQMWCLTAPGVVVHRIRDDKSAATFGALFGNFHGTIVCDALKTHEAGAREGPGIVLAGCWAHVFRKFEEALPDHPDAQRGLEWTRSIATPTATSADSPSCALCARRRCWPARQQRHRARDPRPRRRPQEPLRIQVPPRDPGRRDAVHALETAKLHDIDPAAYLAEAVRAADRGDVLLPWQFTGAR